MTDHIHSHSIADLDEVQLDLGRRDRCGFPEVIYGEGKTKETILKIFRSLKEHGLDGFATRIDAEKGQFLEQELLTAGWLFRYNSVARTFRLLPDSEPPTTTTTFCGKIAVISAGTSDAPIAEEARETALWTGADVVFIQDIGVAGPHRLQAKLPEFRDADAIVVVAGMEGALPSVVGGFVSCPVIAVPTSVGYGASFGGLAALLGMLNSCASNVTVVNIDAGFKAGYVAGLIAKRRTKNEK
ncbi:MAG: nickel pincer cofactor biosynthesis protein LarB [Planctomycetaceae bacterium]|jgi:NCAIR mutase (PurE)-related protein|nr:nickel pincer cofactor biosynthesis protein LarB [Planctomycetaceae bacterium]